MRKWKLAAKAHEPFAERDRSSLGATDNNSYNYLLFVMLIVVTSLERLFESRSLQRHNDKYWCFIVIVS